MDMSRNLAGNASGVEWVAHHEVGRCPRSRGRETLARRHAHLRERADASPLPVGRRSTRQTGGHALRERLPGAADAESSPAGRLSSPSGGSSSAIACDSSPGILSRLSSHIVRTITFSPFADMPPSSPPGVGEACDCGVKNIKRGLTQPS